MARPGVWPWRIHPRAAGTSSRENVLATMGVSFLTADNNARLDRLLDPLSSPLAAPLRLVARRFLRLCGLWSPNSGFQPKRHYPGEIDRSIGECGFENVKSCSIGFGPFTFLGKVLFTDTVGVRLHRVLQALASRRSWSLLRWTGSHYLALVTKA